MAALTVEEATARILSPARPLSSETVAIAEADGRTLATDLSARVTAPPFDASAMDGYAVRSIDVARLPADLSVIGEAAAGHAFAGSVGAGEAVRIFTGAPIPLGADAVVIQENTRASAAGPSRITVIEGRPDRGHIRTRGFDFAPGYSGLLRGRRLGPREITLAAAMGHGELPVIARPTVAVLATGDELVLPGTMPGPAQIIASNHLGVMTLCERAGARTTFLGIARDTAASLDQHLAVAGDYDLLITIGGASVGDHDLVAPALRRRGVALDFWKIAMRPGKPMMFGRLGGTPSSVTHVLGLPGNPVSALICAALFVTPLIRALQGDPAPVAVPETGIAGVDLSPNGPRAHYMRAVASPGAGGRRTVTPVQSQDSSLLSAFAAANVLLLRPIDAPAIPRGATVPLLPLDF